MWLLLLVSTRSVVSRCNFACTERPLSPGAVFGTAGVCWPSFICRSHRPVSPGATPGRVLRAPSSARLASSLTAAGWEMCQTFRAEFAVLELPAAAVCSQSPSGCVLLRAFLQLQTVPALPTQPVLLPALALSWLNVVSLSWSSRSLGRRQSCLGYVTLLLRLFTHPLLAVLFNCLNAPSPCWLPEQLAQNGLVQPGYSQLRGPVWWHWYHAKVRIPRIFLSSSYLSFLVDLCQACKQNTKLLF